MATVRVALTAEATAVLLHELPGALRSHVQEALLAALTRALAIWVGGGPLLVDLETHGRERLSPDLDLSRTVGWFTAIHPLVLELDAAEPSADLAAVLPAVLTMVKERLRAVPRGGIGYGALRYLSPRAETTARLAALPQAAVAFNYLGQFPEPAGFRTAPESAGPWSNPLLRRRHQLFVFAGIWSGRLETGFAFSANLHRQATIEALAASFRTTLVELLRRAQAGETAGWTPTDFPLAGLSRAELECALETAEFEGA